MTDDGFDMLWVGGNKFLVGERLADAVRAEIAHLKASPAPALLAELERLREAACWIPVEERLPQSWDDVLVSDGKTVCLGYWNFHEWDAIFGRLPFEVAYWRPLPEPPKGE